MKKSGFWSRFLIGSAGVLMTSVWLAIPEASETCQHRIVKKETFLFAKNSANSKVLGKLLEGEPLCVLSESELMAETKQGWLLKGDLETIASVSPSQDIGALDLNQRKAVWRDIVLAKRNQFQSTELLFAMVTMKHQVSREKIDEIFEEGLKNKWPFPPEYEKFEVKKKRDSKPQNTSPNAKASKTRDVLPCQVACH